MRNRNLARAGIRIIVQDQRYFEVASADIESGLDAEQKRCGMSISVYDGSTTTLRIRTAEREQEFSYYALDDFADEFPTVRPLAQIAAIEKRLWKLHDEVYAGGKERIAIALAKANELARQIPIPAMTSNDYVRTEQINGHKTSIFEHSRDDRTVVSIAVEFFPGGEPKATLSIRSNSNSSPTTLMSKCKRP